MSLVLSQTYGQGTAFAIPFALKVSRSVDLERKSNGFGYRFVPQQDLAPFLGRREHEMMCVCRLFRGNQVG